MKTEKTTEEIAEKLREMAGWPSLFDESETLLSAADMLSEMRVASGKPKKWATGDARVEWVDVAAGVLASRAVRAEWEMARAVGEARADVAKAEAWAALEISACVAAAMRAERDSGGMATVEARKTAQAGWWRLGEQGGK